MSYGYHRLPRKATAADYIVAEANKQSVVVAIGVEIQGNQGIGYTPNIPGDDQSMPEMSQSMLVVDQGVTDISNQKAEVVAIAKSQGYTGDICVNCHGARLKQAGHCAVCEDCGQTTGCS